MKSATAAIAVISAVHITYALGISSFACTAIKDQPEFMSKSAPLSDVSIMVAVADGVLLLLCIVTDIVAFFVAIHYTIAHAYMVLSCTLFYALLSILFHCPYIILAYINDASLTGSMFIFYTASWGLIFLAINRFYTVYQDTVLPQLKFLIPGGPETSTQARCQLFCKSFIFILCSLVFSILIIGSVALLTCYLVILPITNGLSHLFGRLIDTYHTAIVIVGAFVAYKTFIERPQAENGG